MRIPRWFFITGVVWLVVIEVGAEWWYRSHESPARDFAAWSPQWPTTISNFRELPIDDGVKNALRFDSGREVAWNSNDGRCLLYFFRWNPGGSSILRARAHRPDICLPSAGWKQTVNGGVRRYRATDNLNLPFHYFAFNNPHSRVYAHTFFCVWEDRPGNIPDAADAPTGATTFVERWRAVLHGVRNQGQQVMEFAFLTSKEISQSEMETRFAEMLPSLVKETR